MSMYHTITDYFVS